MLSGAASAGHRDVEITALGDYPGLPEDDAGPEVGVGVPTVFGQAAGRGVVVSRYAR